MLRLLLALLMGGASAACAMAAVGWTLYAHSPAAAGVAQVFAGFGFVAGLACGGLQLVFHGRPAQAPAALPPEALASLVRATLASAAAERQARPGSAADRRPGVGVVSLAAAPAGAVVDAPLSPAPQPRAEPRVPAEASAA